MCNLIDTKYCTFMKSLSIRYTVYFHQEKVFTNFTIYSHWQRSVNFFSNVKYRIADMATFITLAKILSLKNCYIQYKDSWGW